MFATTQSIQTQRVSHRLTLTGFIYLENCRGEPWVARKSPRNGQVLWRHPARCLAVPSSAHFGDPIGGSISTETAGSPPTESKKPKKSRCFVQVYFDAIALTL